MSPIKEPHFFSTDFSRGDIETLNDYKSLFEGAKEEHIAVGEASTEYLYSEEAVPEIERIYPGSRYIVMVRNPVDLAYSLYVYEKKGGREVLDSFEKAWFKSPDRRQGEWVNRWCSDSKWLDYQKVASLGQQLERLFKRVDKSRVLVLVLDDVKANPREEYLNVLRFLGLDDDCRASFEPENEAKTRKWPFLTQTIQVAGALSRGLKKKIGIPVYRGTGFLNFVDRISSEKPSATSLDPRMRAELMEYFYQDIELLSLLIDRDLSGWLSRTGGPGRSDA